MCRDGLPKDLTAAASPSLLLPANHLFFAERGDQAGSALAGKQWVPRANETITANPMHRPKDAAEAVDARLGEEACWGDSPTPAPKQRIMRLGSYVSERRVYCLRCNRSAAPVDVRSRRHSFPSIDSTTDNSIDPARRAVSGWVVSSVVSIRSALRSVSNLPTTRRS
jgi:hypothetical protein